MAKIIVLGSLVQRDAWVYCEGIWNETFVEVRT